MRHDPDRRYRWLLRYMKGESQAAIAASAGMSRQFVFETLRRLGIKETGQPSGLWNLKFLRAVIPPRARKAYSTQRSAANTRGIAWGFTVETWWAVWRDSGKWGVRGYVMARTGDVGGYEPGNVRITTIAENAREAVTGRAADWALLKKIKNGECRVVPA